MIDPLTMFGACWCASLPVQFPVSIRPLPVSPALWSGIFYLLSLPDSLALWAWTSHSYQHALLSGLILMVQCLYLRGVYCAVIKSLLTHINVVLSRICGFCLDLEEVGGAVGDEDKATEPETKMKGEVWSFSLSLSHIFWFLFHSSKPLCQELKSQQLLF